MNTPEHFETVIVGGGQAGLAMGYHLAQQRHSFAILDANAHVGDAWRNRWDSLRLFTPARYCGLDGMAFPGRGDAFPSKDEMADYLAAYAARFALPVRSGIKVDRLARRGARFVLSAGDLTFEADNVIVAVGELHKPKVPPFARALDPSVGQVHSSAYRNSSQLQSGGVLIVGAGNSGADIALEVVRDHRTWMAGIESGVIPFRIDTPIARVLLVRLVRLVGHHLLTMDSPVGRRLRPKIMASAAPLVRVKPKDLLAAGVERVSRVVGTRDGLPLLEDGRVLDVANVIWGTGFRPGFSWIDLPIFDADERPMHNRGVVSTQPGLYFMGLKFQYAMSSDTIIGVGRDARHVARHLADARATSRRQTGVMAPQREASPA